METELYKVRSLSSAMKAAYDMYRTNIKTIFRRTWIPAVAFALLISIGVVLFYGSGFQQPTAMPSASDMALLIFGGIFTLAAIVASIWYDAVIISLLNGASMKANLPRVIRFALLVLATVIVVSIIATFAGMIPFAAAGKKGITPDMLTASGIITVAVYFIYVIAILPMLYSSMKYFMEPKQKVLSVFGKPYCTGWRHWGYLFMLSLLASIIISIIYFIVSMPMVITSLAAGVDAAGIALGDASGLPGYFKLLAFLASLISSFIMIYVGAWFTIIVYYAYGHIEAKEKERKERKNMSVQAIQTTEKEPDFEEIK